MVTQEDCLVRKLLCSIEMKTLAHNGPEHLTHKRERTSLSLNITASWVTLINYFCFCWTSQLRRTRWTELISNDILRFSISEFVVEFVKFDELFTEVYD